ncbi:MAG: hypothetical protein ACE5F6_03990 [Anaerolineae bacterium]
MKQGNQKKLIFDASSLIASAQFGVASQLIIQYILSYAEVVIPEEVKNEAVDQGLSAGYTDAQALDGLVKGGAIRVEAAQQADPTFEQVVDAYGIENGDEEVLRLCRQTPDYDYVIVDDRLLYLIIHRFGMRPLFLPDLIVMMAREGAVSETQAEQMLDAIKSRYRAGFIEHAVQVLKGAL